jgi:hypothetical protein
MKVASGSRERDKFLGNCCRGEAGCRISASLPPTFGQLSCLSDEEVMVHFQARLHDALAEKVIRRHPSSRGVVVGEAS